jgi:hypothetical protein
MYVIILRHYTDVVEERVGLTLCDVRVLGYESPDRNAQKLFGLSTKKALRNAKCLTILLITLL